ncbi:MAG: alpha/beta hydrolase [Proteobacteria bacterium]|nr:alpha/beta hydrolase [Pseudomonadota bacterium]
MARRAQANDANAPAVAAARTLAYGADPKQVLDYWPAAGGAKRAPLVLFVHGGAWSMGDKATATGKWKPAHFPAAGYAFASIDYRLVPQVRVEDEAADVAHALRYLLDHAAELGIDPGRVVLMGHSAGAHLVALVGTDEQYLRGAGLSLASVKGVIPLDGAGYDVPRQMGGNAPRLLQQKYEAAFGNDPARQRALSPTFAAAADRGRLPPFLLLHVQRPDGIAQAEELEGALKAAGAEVQRQGFPGEGLAGHGEINRRIGDPAYPATPVIDAWLKRLLAG